jgi:hypothetical protein
LFGNGNDYGPKTLGDCRLWRGEKKAKDKRFVNLRNPGVQDDQKALGKDQAIVGHQRKK